MRQAIAEFMRLALSLVHIDVKAGSVIVEATVEVPAADADTKRADLELGFGSKAAISSRLNVTALSEPSFDSPNNGDSKLSGGVIAAIVILVLAFAVLVPLLVCYFRGKTDGGDKKVTVTSNTKAKPPTVGQPDSM